ncbi:hypothetical protein [Kitasatospora sp. NPDC094015]|uniref:hypothetical protein n=1 Tax=Kitasatospora sp. NPDC094015 TaxID=3155205 RepID=UPI003316E57D
MQARLSGVVAVPFAMWLGSGDGPVAPSRAVLVFALVQLAGGVVLHVRRALSR